MNLDYNEEEIEFQSEVKSFLQAQLPQELADKVKSGRELAKEDIERWQAILNSKGWLANHWPEAYGGVKWSPVQRHIFEEECCFANAPRILPFGLNMLGPVLLAFGSEKQKRYFLPKILGGSHWWCQGFSEPGAGSDLASLKTTAVLKDGHYIVNGQKTWTTLGQHANWIFCLVRTSNEGKPQTGISFLLIELDTPGIEMRPIKLLDGRSEVNEVFFQNVKVPIENLVGEENKGWDYAKYLLTYERTNIAGVGASIHALNQLKEKTKIIKIGNTTLFEDKAFSQQIAKIEIELEAMKVMNLKVLMATQEGGAPGLESSMLKIKGTEIQQSINHLSLKALGPYAVFAESNSLPKHNMNTDSNNKDRFDLSLLGASASFKYFNNRKLSIFGGSNEIQKTIIAKHQLGF